MAYATAPVIGLVAWCALIGYAPARSVVAHEQVPNMARTLGSGLFLIAGVLDLVRWRLTYDARAAHFAVAMLAIGTALPAVSTIGPLLHEPNDMAQTPPSTRALFLVPVFALLLRGTSRALGDRGRPISLRFTARTGAVSALALVATLMARRLISDGEARVLWLMLALTSAGGWLLVAHRSYRTAEAGLRPDGYLTSGFTLLATAEVARAWSLSGPAAAVGIAPGLQLAAAVLVVRSAARSLRLVYRADASHTAELARAVVDLKEHLDAVEAAQRERLHDARSAVVGVLGASELLSTDGAPEPEVLRGLMTAELERLRSMLDTRATEPICDFSLAEVLTPVVLVGRLDGAAIDADFAALRVAGRPRTTATVLDNLLRNARVHAPGARVWIRAARQDNEVRIVVEDDGPGIPADERDAVLCRGVRGRHASAPGDGLGLYTSARAIRAQGGSLQLDESPGGGTRVTLVLPGALAVQQAMAS